MAGFAAIALGLSDAMEREHREQHEAEVQSKRTLIDVYSKLLEHPRLGDESRQEVFRSLMAVAHTPPGKVVKGIEKDPTHVFQPPKPSAEAQAPQQVPLPPGMMGGGEEVPTAPGMLRANELPPPPPAISAPPQTMSFTPPAPPSYGGTVERGWGFIPPEEISAMQLAGERGRYQALYEEQEKAREGSEVAGRKGRMEMGRELGLTGDDLANFVINKTIRDPATRSTLALVIGTMNGKPAYAWKDPIGLLREYTTSGPGRPLNPSEFTPKEGGDSLADQQIASLIAGGMSHDAAVNKVWADSHRPPQPQILYVPGAGLINKQTGAVVNDLVVPTSATRTMTEAAPKVTHLIERILPQIAEQEATLGPAASRWSEFMAGKVGAPNPKFIQLRTNITLLTTMLMRMHVGARGGVILMEHFKELMDVGKQSPENLRAAVGEIKLYAEDVMKSGAPNMGATTGGALPPIAPGRIRMKKGNEVLDVQQSDVGAATKDGYTKVQ